MCKFKNENGSLQMFKHVTAMDPRDDMSNFFATFEKVIEVEGNSRLIEECAQ